MFLPLLLLILATLIPLASFVVLVFAGRRMGTPFAGLFGTGMSLLSFGFSLWGMIVWMATKDIAWGFGNNAIYRSMRWLPMGTAAASNPEHPGWLDVAIYVDSLTIAMFSMVTVVAALIHVFSIGYMREDKRFPRFFTYLALFSFSMLGLVIAGTILQIFIFWELVGLCSYLLIGFWYEKKSAANAAIKAFVTNRIGDFGFLIGLGIVFYLLGNAALPQMWLALGDAGQGAPILLPGGMTVSVGMLTIMGICLFAGAVAKSAQFPLHVWLPDAMEGPTPVSAFIHAATMVAAGVYLVGRIFPILTPDAKLFIAITGCTTLTMGALIAIVQSDIKRLLAFSTISQLGYMMLAIGLGSWVGGLFHLITHAFFKALLFLGAASVIRAANHEQELPYFGGLWRKIPVTAITFGVAVLAIAGTPFLSGYYSKEMILAHAGAFATLASGQGAAKWYWLFFVLPVGVAYVTAFYMARCWMLTFAGQPRDPQVFENARESPLMWAPLVLLAFLSIIAGRWMNVQELLEESVKESSRFVEQLALKDPFYATRSFSGWSTAWPTKLRTATADPATDVEIEPPKLSVSELAHEHGEQLAGRYGLWAFAFGLGAGVLLYLRGYAVAGQLMKIPPLQWMHRWLYHRMFFDELYFGTVVALTVFLSRLSGWLDRHVIDRLVNGSAWLVRESAMGAGAGDRYVVDGAVAGVGRLAESVGAAARAPQTGRIRLYVLILFTGIAICFAALVVGVMSR